MFQAIIFFTGESDNDFVSLSSGSNPRKAPKKANTNFGRTINGNIGENFPETGMW